MITCSYDSKNQMELVLIHSHTLLNTFYIIWTHIYDLSDREIRWGCMTGPVVKPYGRYILQIGNLTDGTSYRRETLQMHIPYRCNGYL